MSEYQYYEFRTVDRPLDRAAQKALRSISSRARITATSFTNHYEWGDLKGDPRRLVEQWFDLHLYLTNWGTRRLIMRLPKLLVNRSDVGPFLREVDWVELWVSGDHLIMDICREEAEDELEDDSDEDGSAWLDALAPLRADLLSGDFRLLYLLWLTALQDGLIGDDAIGPLPGLGPLTDALRAFADFIRLDPDLVEAAAGRGAEVATSEEDRRDMLAALPEAEKTAWLLRIMDGDLAVAAELRGRLRKQRPSTAASWTAGALRKRAGEVAQVRDLAAAERRHAELHRQAIEAEKARRSRISALKERGEGVWREVETEIERRNASGYDRAASLLSDLEALASEDGSLNDFRQRLDAIRTRHEKKEKFLERLNQIGRSDTSNALI
jgi:hypothetical protein